MTTRTERLTRWIEKARTPQSATMRHRSATISLGPSRDLDAALRTALLFIRESRIVLPGGRRRA